jgi:hypothetical protein
MTFIFAGGDRLLGFRTGFECLGFRVFLGFTFCVSELIGKLIDKNLLSIITPHTIPQLSHLTLFPASTQCIQQKVCRASIIAFLLAWSSLWSSSRSISHLKALSKHPSLRFFLPRHASRHGMSNFNTQIQFSFSLILDYSIFF